MEACRIEVRYNARGEVDVSAPMAHKALCYDLLKQAGAVIEVTAPGMFWPNWREFAIVMDMAGTVDISAPLPPKDLALRMLKLARAIIERYEGPAEDAKVPELRA